MKRVMTLALFLGLALYGFIGINGDNEDINSIEQPHSGFISINGDNEDIN